MSIETIGPDDEEPRELTPKERRAAIRGWIVIFGSLALLWLLHFTKSPGW
jgi:hypothetical protein